MDIVTKMLLELAANGIEFVATIDETYHIHVLVDGVTVNDFTGKAGMSSLYEGFCQRKIKGNYLEYISFGRHEGYNLHVQDLWPLNTRAIGSYQQLYYYMLSLEITSKRYYVSADEMARASMNVLRVERKRPDSKKKARKARERQIESYLERKGA